MDEELIVKSAPAPREVDYPPEGIGMGNGWDSQLGRKTSVEAVKFKEAPNRLGGQEKNYYGCQILNRSSLLEELDVSAEGSYEGWGAKVSAKVEFSREVEVNELSQSFVAHAVVKNPARYAAPLEGAIDLKPEYAELARRDPAEFRRQCGDCFVSSIQEGGELVAVLTFTVTDRSEKKEIAASMKGSGWGVSLSGGVSSNIETAFKNEQLTIHYCQSGGSGDVLPTNLDEILEKVQDLPRLAEDHPYPYKIGLTRYDTLPSWPRGVTVPDLQPYRDLLVQYNRYKDLYELIGEILENPRDFLLGRGVTEDSLKKVQDELMDGLRAIKHVLGETIEYRQDPVSLPEEASKSDYEFRARLPLPCAYCPDDEEIDEKNDKEISIFIDSDTLKKFVFEQWIKRPNRICKDPLKHEELEEYEQMIEVDRGLLETGDVITLQAVNGKYLSLIRWGDHDEIWAAKDEIDPFSKFTVTGLHDGKIALQAQAPNGKYLSLIRWGDHDVIWAAKDKIDPFSRFTVKFPSRPGRPYEGKIALQAPNGKWVNLVSYKVKDDWQSRIEASTPEIHEFSEFTVRFSTFDSPPAGK